MLEDRGHYYVQVNGGNGWETLEKYSVLEFQRSEIESHYMEYDPLNALFDPPLQYRIVYAKAYPLQPADPPTPPEAE